MPQPDEVGERADRLIAIWSGSHARLAVELRRLADEIGRAAGNRRTRLLIRSRVVRDLLAVVDRELELVRSESKAWIEGDLITVYGIGAEGALGAPLVWSTPHVAAVQVLADQTWDDVLTASDFTSSSVRRAISDATRVASQAAVTDGTTSVRAAQQAARGLLEQGIGTVRYANGSYRTIADYMDMAIRTRTAIAYNAGTLNSMSSIGVEFVEVFDGFDCGLTSHRDPYKVNGAVLPIDVAHSYPIAHPRCRRSFSSRLDVVDIDAESLAAIESVRSLEQREDQAAFERAMASQATSQRNRRRRPTSRRRTVRRRRR